MALVSNSPGLQTRFRTSYSDSTNPPAQFNSVFPNSGRPAKLVDSLPLPPQSPYSLLQHSPVDSNDSKTTDIEDDAQDYSDQEEVKENNSSQDIEFTSVQSDSTHEKCTVDTTFVNRDRSNSDEAPLSVIRAPAGFKKFESMSSPSDRSEVTVVSPLTPESSLSNADSPNFMQLDTSVVVSQSSDRQTPRAQTRQEVEDWKQRSRASKNLEDIAEMEDLKESESESRVKEPVDDGTLGETVISLSDTELEVALKTALSECWTLCNTLAGLSAIHRERMFSCSGKRDVQELAWRSCWRLCQNLYESRNEDHLSQVSPTLDLCREFCHALFEVRLRGDEVSDSVLRVSFELSNHLYNTRDRNLPDAFRERTLDFYLTLCHRLMKQRTCLPEETDSLLRACWTLAEMLFHFRQNNRDGKPLNEELLGSAVQACWELCDLFREGWSQIRPDRGTPRPVQSTFPSNTSYASRPISDRTSSVGQSFHNFVPCPPETPTTIIDDTAELSPQEPNPPNILVLGPENGITRTHDRWSSAASSLSCFSENSHPSSSTEIAVRGIPGASNGGDWAIDCRLIAQPQTGNQGAGIRGRKYTEKRVPWRDGILH